MRDVLEVSRAALCLLARGIYEGEVGPSGKVVAISTAGALGLAVFLQHRVNESCEDVKRPTVVFYGCFLVIEAHGGTWFRTP